MMSATLIFSGELIFFFKESGDRVVRHIVRFVPIKDVIESLGVPHTEVGRILSDSGELDFAHIVSPGERIEIHPFTIPLDVTRPTVLRPCPLARLAFVVDVNVAKLASLLRLVGFDTAYERDCDDFRIAELAELEGRIVLTRDRNLLKRKRIVFGRLVRSQHPWEQLEEVSFFLGLKPYYHLFCRCPLCNGVLKPVSRAEVLDRLEPLTKLYYDEFNICSDCGRVYWNGSHHDRIMRRLGRK